MGGPRLLVARPLYDTVLGILAEAVPGVPVGDPRQPETVVGPMAGERHLEKVEEYVELARKEGGRIVCGGERLDLDGGYYYKPTVIADLANDSRVVQEEIFGPVLTVQPFDTEDEAVELANSTPYGLASGLQTTDLARAHRVADRLQAGIVWVNDWAMLDPAVPFGGVKDSGFGREYGPEALAVLHQGQVRRRLARLSAPGSLSRPTGLTKGVPRMSTTTRAAVVESGGAPFTLSEVDLDEPAPGRGPRPHGRRRPVPHRPRRRERRAALPAARGPRPRGRRRRRGRRLRRHLRRARRPRRAVLHLLRRLPQLPRRAPGVLRHLAAAEPARRPPRRRHQHHQPRRRGPRRPLLRPVLLRRAGPGRRAQPRQGRPGRTAGRPSPRWAAASRPASAPSGTSWSPARAAPSSSSAPARSACRR